VQTIVPILRYRDARAAIRSLCACFGFVELFSEPPSGDIVRHARLQLGTNEIMLGSTRPDDGIESPLELGAATQGLCVYVDDVDAHFERARAAGATIAGAPEDAIFGRSYQATDIEGHPWTFSSPPA
jgi:PhnB protein